MDIIKSLLLLVQNIVTHHTCIWALQHFLALWWRTMGKSLAATCWSTRTVFLGQLSHPPPHWFLRSLPEVSLHVGIVAELSVLESHQPRFDFCVPDRPEKNRQNLAGQNLTGSWYDAADFDWYLIHCRKERLKSPCTASTALIEVQGLLRRSL